MNGRNSVKNGNNSSFCRSCEAPGHPSETPRSGIYTLRAGFKTPGLEFTQATHIYKSAKVEKNLRNIFKLLGSESANETSVHRKHAPFMV
ncbi:hypothetical protein BFO01nite_25760 [Brevibacillus formosus]|uniref:Uncharacterized protein n=1 Tax=Brevibacillus formosus TaxID=54913 RepID=A0ABQ0T785_9BACL|nr:hypothetical protein BFO01nite_25760 [Brevibacillus formosus]